VPEGWGRAGGPGLIDPARGRFAGQVAFNSWGKEEFWTHQQQNGNSYTYSPGVMMSQVRAGGAYVALVEINGPPRIPGDSPPEYASNELGDLLENSRIPLSLLGG
jgi:hypothetical protein